MRLLGLGILAQVVACAVVGARLLRLWRRTGKLPELAYGCAFLLLGAIGFPLSIPARTGMVGPTAAGVLLALALTAQDAASLSIGVATWKTFRPELPWLAPLLAACGALFAVSLVGQQFEVGYAGGRDGGGFYWLGLGLRFAPFAWTCAESFRYHAALRRRLALGLADPVVTDRIRLWALACLAICLGFAVFTAGRLLTANAAASPTVLAVTSAVALSSSVAMTLAFFPPAAYLRRVAGRRADRGAGAPPT
jgi:hypothetical protein